MMGREQAFIDVGTRGHTCLKSAGTRVKTFSCSSVLRSTNQTDQFHVQQGQPLTQQRGHVCHHITKYELG